MKIQDFTPEELILIEFAVKSEIKRINGTIKNYTIDPKISDNKSRTELIERAEGLKAQFHLIEAKIELNKPIQTKRNEPKILTN